MLVGALAHKPARVNSDLPFFSGFLSPLFYAASVLNITFNKHQDQADSAQMPGVCESRAAVGRSVWVLFGLMVWPGTFPWGVSCVFTLTLHPPTEGVVHQALPPGSFHAGEESR
ncbi:hypothetical protein P7K49_009079 [Saguinus oedipus]|uniref:Uncharacterized protein n=1 Tax=Saguinus oedipus TaxID=9490 RepID=A0ABQ9VZI2_SAGOE|nr:hypothetical protein P7K49_009079 [Saguinus oedipus]